MSAAVQTISVSCNHCGAPLRLAGGTKFATCGYCGAQLQLHVEGGAAYTEVLEKIDAQTQQIAADMREIKKHELLDEVDRDWAQTSASFNSRDRQGNQRSPGMVGSIIGGLIGV